MPGTGLLIGSVTRPDGWYAALAKPAFNPPTWVFAPVYAMIRPPFAIPQAAQRPSGTPADLSPP